MSKVSVAVIGLNGALGQPILHALASEPFSDKIEFPIRGITRKSDTQSTVHVNYIQADLANTEDVAEKLKGVDVIIELVSANPVLFGQVEKIVEAVKPKLFIPSHFGTHIPEAQKILPGFLALKHNHPENVRKTGIKTIEVLTNFFSKKGAYTQEVAVQYGIDGAKKVVNQIGDADTKISISTLPDIGNTVAAIVTHPDFTKLPDNIRIYSESVTFQDVWDSWGKTHDVSLEVVSKKTADEAAAETRAALAESGIDFSKFLYYLQVVASHGSPATFFYENERDVINPNESLFKWSKWNS